MKFKLACADFSFPLLSHDQSLELISMLDFEGVDIGLFEERSHLWPSREFQNTDSSAARLKKSLTARGLSCADLFLQMAPDFVPFAINHPDSTPRKKARDWFLHALDYAAGIGAPHVTALPGVRFDSESADDSWQRACEELAWRVEQARSRNIIFGTEAHVGSLAATPVDAERLVRDVPGLTLTLDYTHFTREGRPDSDIEPLLSHASHFHVRGAQPDRLQCSYKDNQIDYGRILDVMKENRYAGYIGVEYVWIDWEHCNEVDNLSETILFRDFLRSH